MTFLFLFLCVNNINENMEITQAWIAAVINLLYTFIPLIVKRIQMKQTYRDSDNKC